MGYSFRESRRESNAGRPTCLEAHFENEVTKEMAVLIGTAGVETECLGRSSYGRTGRVRNAAAARDLDVGWRSPRRNAVRKVFRELLARTGGVRGLANEIVSRIVATMIWYSGNVGVQEAFDALVARVGKATVFRMLDKVVAKRVRVHRFTGGRAEDKSSRVRFGSAFVGDDEARFRFMRREERIRDFMLEEDRAEVRLCSQHIIFLEESMEQLRQLRMRKKRRQHAAMAVYG